MEGRCEQRALEHHHHHHHHCYHCYQLLKQETFQHQLSHDVITHQRSLILLTATTTTSRSCDSMGNSKLHTMYSRLVVSSVRLSTVGSRAFPVAAPRISNALPEETTSAQSLTSFRRHLKSWLFSQSYPDLIIWSLLYRLSNCVITVTVSNAVGCAFLQLAIYCFSVPRSVVAEHDRNVPSSSHEQEMERQEIECSLRVDMAGDTYGSRW